MTHAERAGSGGDGDGSGIGDGVGADRTDFNWASSISLNDYHDSSDCSSGDVGHGISNAINIGSDTSAEQWEQQRQR